MLRFKTFVAALTLAVAFSACPQSAEAGPLLDWLRGVCRGRQTVPTGQNYYTGLSNGCNTCATPSYQETAFQQQPQQSLGQHNPAGLQPGQCMRTCNQTCSRTVVNYVPQTCYRTAWNRVPVTQYKPVTNSDPCTGCTVTCMRPCTSYTWQMKREPYTTYRPVYRQENYTVPVTTITNDCATGGCNTGCSTCPTSPQVVYPGTVQAAPATTYGQTYSPIVQQPTYAPQGTYYTDQSGAVVSPQGTITTQGGYETNPFGVPADSTPSLNVNPQNSQRPVIDQLNGNDSSTSWPQIQGPLQTRNQPRHNVRPVSLPGANQGWMNEAPSFVPRSGKTARSPVTKRYSYSPVRFASHDSENKEETAKAITESRPVYNPAKRVKVKSKTRKANSGWTTVEW